MRSPVPASTRRHHLALALPCWGVLGAAGSSLCTAQSDPPPPSAPYILVLGTAQDAGYPQAACRRGCCAPAWHHPELRRNVASLAIVDPATHQRWIIDATPDFREQLRLLDEAAPPDPDAPGAASQPLLDGILLTHAHIGHYTGLQSLGREVASASAVPVYAMPRMAEFLEHNGPWSQLVSLHNIDIRPLTADTPVALNDRITITPIPVPHRDEFSETVAFRIDGPSLSALYLPDIDKWEKWDALGRRIEDEIAKVNIAYLDATFFSGDELGGPGSGRDISQIPHPFVVESLARFAALPPEERAKIRFIHLNHTNPLLRTDAAGDAARSRVEHAGMHVAEQGERSDLTPSRSPTTTR